MREGELALVVVEEGAEVQEEGIPREENPSRVSSRFKIWCRRARPTYISVSPR